MAINEVKYVCGCGYSTRVIAEAVSHCDKRGHTMCANGVIKPLSRIPKDMHSRRPIGHENLLETPIAPEVEALAERVLIKNFDNLRSRIK